MEISDIKIRKTMHDGRLRAVVSVTLDNAVAIHDIKVVQGDDRLFVAMPSRREEHGVYRDIIHPISTNAPQRPRKQHYRGLQAVYLMTVPGECSSPG